MLNVLDVFFLILISSLYSVKNMHQSLLVGLPSLAAALCLSPYLAAAHGTEVLLNELSANVCA